MATYDLKDDSVVAVIGSGAGGGTLANELCQKGIKVVLLEAGKRESTDSFQNDEWGSFGQLSWLDKRTSSGSWRVAKDFAGLPAWICKTVGGSTVHWAGASLRLQEHELKVKSTYGDIPGANLLDWPLTLQDLEPYYAKAEDKMGTTRTNDIPGLPGNNNFKVMYAGAKRLGYKGVHTGRMSINSRPRDDRAACLQIGFCFQGCKSGAKWSTLYREVPKAEATGKLELRTQAQVLQIEHDDSGKVTGVLYAGKDGKQQVQKARAVAVAGNAIETPRLLLNSASSKLPDGLAMSRVVVCTSMVTLALLTAFLIAATPLGTAFTFQGQLKLSGSPVDNTSPGCDFEFSLWDDPSAGNQLGSTQSLIGVPVSNGVFTVELNDGGEFGPDAFKDEERYLDSTNKLNNTALSPATHTQQSRHRHRGQKQARWFRHGSRKTRRHAQIINQDRFGSFHKRGAHREQRKLVECRIDSISGRVRHGRFREPDGVHKKVDAIVGCAAAILGELSNQQVIRRVCERSSGGK